MTCEREPWFPALRQYVDGNGYEVVTMLDGERSAVPMNSAQPLADLDRAEKIADAARSYQDALDSAAKARVGGYENEHHQLAVNACHEVLALALLLGVANSQPQAKE